MASEHCKCLERHSDCFNNGTCYICNACGKVYYEGAPDSPNRMADKLIQEAIAWDIHYRIAAKLHLSGIRSDEVDFDRISAPAPMLLAVARAMKALESGEVDHDAIRRGVRSLASLSEET